MTEQNFNHHTKWVPAFHFFVAPVLLLNFGWSIYRWKVSGFSFNGAIDILVAAALLIFIFVARLFALTVQDRVIRLEERLRFAQLFPPDLRSRIEEFSIAQLVSLRFASGPRSHAKCWTRNLPTAKPSKN
jgi:hypothetical protein